MKKNKMNLSEHILNVDWKLLSKKKIWKNNGNIMRPLRLWIGKLKDKKNFSIDERGLSKKIRQETEYENPNWTFNKINGKRKRLNEIFVEHKQIDYQNNNINT